MASSVDGHHISAANTSEVEWNDVVESLALKLVEIIMFFKATDSCRSLLF